MSEAEGQLDLLALLPTREEQHPTPPRLTASPARGYFAREVAYAEWKRRHGGFDCDRVSHGWNAALCEATGPVTRCQATVLTANLRCACSRGCQCVGDLYYRGACLHGHWEGPVREEQTEAVGDGLDHAHPGWRNSPTVGPRAQPEATPPVERGSEQALRRTTGGVSDHHRAHRTGHPPTPPPSKAHDQNRAQHTQYVHTGIACVACVACYRENRPERGKTK